MSNQGVGTNRESGACRMARSDYRLACDRLDRARRDLTETGAIMLGSLTTVTAIQAVVNIAVDRLGFETSNLQ